MDRLNPENLTGPQKAAIFFLYMGEEFTSSFFKDLDENSIKKLGKYMSKITYIPSNVLNAVLDEFINNFQKEENLLVSGREFLEDIVKKTLDEDLAREVFKVLGNNETDKPFSELAYMPPESLSSMLQGEHPQTVALILSYLPNEKAAEVLGLLPDELRENVAIRILNINNVQDDIIREIDTTIKKNLSKMNISTRRFDGIEKLANILNELDTKTEEAILSFIEKEDENIAERVRQKMFLFEDLLMIDDRGFREILQNVDNQTVAKALKTASEEMKEKVFRNLSERAAEMLRDDMEVMGPVRLKEVEEAQQTIIKTAKKLESEGKIVLAGRGKEDVLV